MTIDVRLSTTSIDSAINTLKDYKARMSSRLYDLESRLAQIGVSIINAELTGAAYAGDAGVIDVHTEFQGNSCVIAIRGEKVAFIEFGAGVNYPEGDYSSAAGASAHGTYGAGQGSNPKGWIYRGGEGTGGMSVPVFDGKGQPVPGVWRTWGNPPANSVTRGVQEIQNSVAQIAREVFSG